MADYKQVNGTNPVTGYPIYANQNIPEIFGMAMSYEEKLAVLGVWVAKLKTQCEQLIDDVNGIKQDIYNALTQLEQQIAEWQAIMDEWSAKWDSMTQTLTNIENQLQDLRNSITNNTNQINTINDMLTSIQQTMNILSNEIVNLKQHTVTLTGDVTGTGTLNTQTTPWSVVIPATVDPSIVQPGGSTLELVDANTVLDIVPVPSTSDTYGVINQPYGSFASNILLLSTTIDVNQRNMTLDTVQPGGWYTIDTGTDEPVIAELTGYNLSGGSNGDNVVGGFNITFTWAGGEIAGINYHIIAANNGTSVDFKLDAANGYVIPGATTPASAFTMPAALRITCPLTLLVHVDVA